MTHKEFKLTASTDIYEYLDAETKAVHFRKGKVISVTEDIFNKLKKGETIRFSTDFGHGMTAYGSYTKNDFENEVEVITIETTTSTAKLGLRKKS